MNKKKILKKEKGITLIALIITIVVLLILALVTIRAVSDGGIIGHAKTASDKHKIAQEEEEIRLALGEWKVQKNIPGYNGSFDTFMSQKLDGKGTVRQNDDGSLTITVESERAYTVTEAGAITLQDVTDGGGTEDQLESGLYVNGTKVKTWAELKAEGYITFNEGILSKGDQAQLLAGELVIDSEVTQISHDRTYGMFYA